MMVFKAFSRSMTLMAEIWGFYILKKDFMLLKKQQ